RRGSGISRSHRDIIVVRRQSRPAGIPAPACLPWLVMARPGALVPNLGLCDLKSSRDRFGRLEDSPPETTGIGQSVVHVRLEAVLGQQDVLGDPGQSMASIGAIDLRELFLLELLRLEGGADDLAGVVARARRVRGDAEPAKSICLFAAGP